MKLRILVIILLLLVTSSATLFLMWWSVQEITYPKEIFQEVEEPVLLEVEPLRSTYVNYKIKGWPQGEISDSMFKKRLLKIIDYEMQDIDSKWSSFEAAPIEGYFSNYMLEINSNPVLRFASSTKAETSIEAIIIYDSNSNLPVHLFDYSEQNLRADFQVCESYKGKGCNYPNKLALNFSSFKEGNYYAQLLTSKGSLSAPIFFGLREEWPIIDKVKDILVVYPSYTWQAYNTQGGESFYTSKPDLLFQVSLDRPVNSSILNDYHNARSSIPFSKLLQDGGYSVLDVTDNDLNNNPDLLKKVKLVVFTSHAEYWTVEVRKALDDYVMNGGKIAAFSGNTGWWQVKEKNNNIYKSGKSIQAEGIYKETGRGFNPWIDNRISNLMGQTYLYGGYSFSSNLKADQIENYFLNEADIESSRAIEVIDSNHPIFKNTGLKSFEQFGGDSDLVFLELDGLPLRGDGKLDRAVYPFFPEEIDILARALIINANVPTPTYTPPGRVQAVAIISEIAHPNDGLVLHLGSIGWYRALANKDQISRKVFLNSVEYLTGKSATFTAKRGNWAMEEINLPKKFVYSPLKKFLHQRKEFQDLVLEDKLIYIDQILKTNSPSSETFAEFIPYVAKGLERKSIVAERISLKTLITNSLFFNAQLTGKSKIVDLFQKTEPITSDLILGSHRELNTSPIANQTIKAILQNWAFWQKNKELSEESCDIFLNASEKGYLPAVDLYKDCNNQVFNTKDMKRYSAELVINEEKKKKYLDALEEKKGEYLAKYEENNSYTLYFKKELKILTIKVLRWFEEITGMNVSLSKKPV